MFYSIIYLWEIIYSAASPVSLILDCSWWRWYCSPLLPLWAQHSATCCRFVFEWLSSSRRISTAEGGLLSTATVQDVQVPPSAWPVGRSWGSSLMKSKTIIIVTAAWPKSQDTTQEGSRLSRLAKLAKTDQRESERIAWMNESMALVFITDEIKKCWSELSLRFGPYIDLSVFVVAHRRPGSL